MFIDFAEFCRWSSCHVQVFYINFMDRFIYFNEGAVFVDSFLLQNGMNIGKILIKNLAPVVQMILGDVWEVFEQLGTDRIKSYSFVVTVHQMVNVRSG